MLADQWLIAAAERYKETMCHSNYNYWPRLVLDGMVLIREYNTVFNTLNAFNTDRGKGQSSVRATMRAEVDWEQVTDERSIK